MLRYCPGSLTLSTLLTASENEWLGTQLHKPLASARVLGSILEGADIHPVLFMNLQVNLDAFIEHTSACEKLLTTPIPLAYFRCALPYDR
jgi:predicted membrane chloride channel (bestrophin family)